MHEKKPIIFYILNFLMLAALAFSYVFFGCSTGIKIILCVMLTVLIYRYSYKDSALFVLTVFAFLAATYFMYIKSDVLNFIIVFLNIALLPVVTGYLFKKNCPYLTTFCISAASNMLLTVAELVKLKFYDKVDLLDVFIKSPVNSAFEPYTDILATYNLSINDIVNSVSTFSPAVMIAAASTVALFYIVISKKIISLIYKDNLNIGSFSEIKLKKSFGSVFAIVGLAIIFMPQSSFSDALINIEIVLSYAFFICGISFVDFYFKKTGLWISVRIILYALAFLLLSVAGIFTLGILNPYTVLVVIAMFDTVHNYRKLDNQ